MKGKIISTWLHAGTRYYAIPVKKKRYLIFDEHGVDYGTHPASDVEYALDRQHGRNMFKKRNVLTQNAQPTPIPVRRLKPMYGAKVLRKTPISCIETPCTECGVACIRESQKDSVCELCTQERYVEACEVFLDKLTSSTGLIFHGTAEIPRRKAEVVRERMKLSNLRERFPIRALNYKIRHPEGSLDRNGHHYVVLENGCNPPETINGQPHRAC